MAAAPVAPEVGGIGALAISFLTLCLCILLFGMVRGAYYLTYAIHFVIQNSIGKLPLVGWIVHEATDSVFAAVERGFADAAIGLQGAIGFYWHWCGVLVHWTAREIRGLAETVEALAHFALPTTWAPLVWGELGKLRALIDGYARGIDRLAGRFESLIASLPGRVERITSARFRGIDHTIDRVLLPDIAGLRARARSAENQIENLWDRVKGLDKLTATEVFAALVATALATLGVSWIRCKNWKKIGRGICGIPSDLIDLLFLDALTAIVVTDLCLYAGAVEALASDLVPVFMGLVDVEEALVGCHGATAPPSRPVPVLSLPSSQTDFALAA
jgi:hypothetical protein